MQRTGCSANMLRRPSNGRSSASLNKTELQRGHLHLIQRSSGSQLGRFQLLSPILLSPFAPLYLPAFVVAIELESESSQARRRRLLHFPTWNCLRGIKQSIEIREPQNENDDNHSIPDRFDLSLHGDEPVHTPQEKPDCNDLQSWTVVSGMFCVRSVSPRSIHPCSGSDIKGRALLSSCF